MSSLLNWFDGNAALLAAASVLVQATLASAAALALSARLRQNAAARYAVLCGALALILASPIVAALAPGTRWSVLSWAAPQEAVDVAAVTSAQVPADALPSNEAKQAVTKTPPPEPLAAVATAERTTVLPDDVATAPQPSHAAHSRAESPDVENNAEVAHADQPSLADMARTAALGGVTVWVVVAAALLVRLAAAWWKLRGMLRRATPCGSEAISAALCEAYAALGARRLDKNRAGAASQEDSAIHVLASAEITSPLAAGVRRPAIVLPIGIAEQVSPAQLRDVLIHEAAHVIRRDQAVVLLQNLAAAVFWLHPLVRRLNVRLAQAREEICDNYVLTATEATRYSRTLLRLTELLQTSEPWVGAVGLFNSRWTLESRVAGILDEGRHLATRLNGRERRRVAAAIVFASLLATGASVVLAADDATSESQAPGGVEATDTPAANDADLRPDRNEPLGEELKLAGDDLIKHLDHASTAAEKSLKRIRTAHLNFRLFLRASDFKPDVTPARMTDLLATHDLVAEPDSLADVVAAIMATPITSQAKWGEMELHSLVDPARGGYLRETRQWEGGEPDIHVVGPKMSLYWRGQNAQMDVTPREDDRMAITQLRDFLAGLPLQAPLSPQAIAALRGATGESLTIDGRQALKVRIGQAGQNLREITLDEQSGLLLRDDSWRGDRLETRQWLGWRESHGGVRFPSVVVELKFTDSKLAFAKFLVVRETRFNIPLADTVFKLGAPAGSVIVRRGSGNEWPARRINRDVFDVTADDEISNATQPYKVQFTPAELDAFEELKRIYKLPDDEVVKRVAPPYSLARKYLARMLNPTHAETPRSDHFYFLVWEGDRLDSDYSLGGITPTLSYLISRIVKHPLTDIDIPRSLLEHKLPGDFVYRPEAPQDQRLAAVNELLTQELGRPVRLAFADVPRNVYVARGELKIDEAKVRQREGRPLIAMNGGDHDGDFGEMIGFGDSAKLLSELGNYLNAKIIDETTPSERDLAWSRRWYDVKTTPAAERFQLKPEAVLALIEEQTGLKFHQQPQPVRVLRLEEK